MARVALLAGAGAVVLLVLVIALWPSGKAEAAASDLYRVATTSFDISIVSNGELESRTKTEIRSTLEKPAAIVQITPEGTIVRAGDLLIQLASDDTKKEIEEELLRVETARSELVTATNDYEIQLSENEFALRQAKLKFELAEIEYEKWRNGDVVRRRQALDLGIEKTERQLNRLKEKFERSKLLFDQGFLSKDELELDQISYIEALAATETARLEKVVYEEYEHPKEYKRLTSDIEEARVEIDRVNRRNANHLTSREANRVNKQRQLEIREERLAKLREQFEATTITAPRDGLVVYATSLEQGRGMMMMGGDGALQIGRNVRPNELLIILPDTREMVASVRVHESLAGRIRPGQKARVTIDAMQGAVFHGEVLSIGVLAESGGWRDPNLREYTVKVALDQGVDTTMLKPAMRAQAEIQLGRVENVLAIPVQAIHNEGPVRYVYTPSGGKYVRTPVQVGRRSDTLVEVRVGLKEGDRVLLREPRPGEVFSTEFDEKALAAVTPPGGAQQGPDMRFARPANAPSQDEQGGQRRAGRPDNADASKGASAAAPTSDKP